jgi:hypothetical protein
MAKFRIIRWFKKKNSKKNDVDHDEDRYQPQQYSRTPPTADFSTKLSDSILQRIFSFVCPHVEDESYESCEQSAVEDTCMLCDLRDLAHCAQVTKKWRSLATNVMYVVEKLSRVIRG